MATGERAKGLKDINQLFHYQALSYVLKVICSELISKH